MHWVILAPFNETDEAGGWLDAFVPGAHHEFDSVQRHLADGPNWQARGRVVSGPTEWKSHWRHVSAAKRRRREGVITVFPQLAAITALRKRLSRGRYPIVAYCFNVAQTYPGMKQRVARFAAQAVDLFVVHTKGEIELYSEWLGVPRERFRFIHMQTNMQREYAVSTDEPFVFATGSGHRDYATMFSALGDTDVRMIVAPGRHTVAGLDIPANAELHFEIERPDLLRLAQQAMVNVVPMHTHGPAAGQVTIIEGMSMGCAMVVTDRPGIPEYFEHERTGLLVPPHDPPALAAAVRRLLDDEPLRLRLSEGAREFARDNFSDEAAGAALGLLLDEVEGRRVTGRAKVERQITTL